jgi:colanic acid/amylovoran biosynthesis glycosyltransferase
MTKKVAFILSSKPGLTETFIKELISGLKKSPVIDLVVFYPINGFEKPLVQLYLVFKSIFFAPKIIKYWNNFPLDYSNLKKVKIILNNLNVLTYFGKLDYIHFPFSNLIHHRAHLGAALGAKTTIGLRGYDITFYPMNHKDAYKNVWHFVDKIQYNSEDLYSWALFWGANPAIPSSWIPAAVNDELVQHNVAKIHKEQKKINVISLGRLHWKKGFDIAIFAIKILQERNVDVQYNIYGEGPEIEKLRFLVIKFQLQQQVLFMGPYNYLQLPDILDWADILLAPSLQEGCSNVCLEAQARGVFCVVSDAEGMNQVVEDQITGLITPIGNAEAIANAIETYYQKDNTNKLNSSTIAINRIKNRFLRSQQMKQWEAFFE